MSAISAIPEKSSKPFVRWTEEERRAHRRAQNATYQARKTDRLTDRQKQVKEEERKKRQETKQAIEQGAWVTTGAKVKVEKVKETVKVKAKNGFAALDSDTEEEAPVEEKEVWGKQKINWADSDDE
jgi:primosomal protein N'